MTFPPDITTVLAARDGDPAAVESLVAAYLPLVYAIVGRALDRQADVDDVVQDTMLRVLGSIGDLRDPQAFRSWLVAITVRRIREHFRAGHGAPAELVPDDVRDPGADFTDLAILRLELEGQRRETAEATRWLDEDDRDLVSLWWLEAAGELTRDEIVDALDVTRQHAAVRIQRVKGQLETARVVVRALAATPRCVELGVLTAGWDGRPGALWRKRIARHTRDCQACGLAWSGLVAPEGLLVGMGLVPVPVALCAMSRALAVGGGGQPSGLVPHASAGPGSGVGHAGAMGHVGTAAHTGAAQVAHVVALGGAGIARRVLTAVLLTAVVAGGGTAVALARRTDPPVVPAASTIMTPTPTPTQPSARVTPQAEPQPSVAPSTPPVQPAPPPAPVAAAPTAAVKKGVSTWQFDGVEPALRDVGAGWYYNWSPSNASMPGPAGVEFVPMIWGAANVTDATLAQAAGAGTTLLGFNEPDMSGQANLSVEDALALWPRLQETGMRLGSPAVAYGGDTPGGWLDRFMAGAAQRGLRVDVITLHWYGSDFSEAAVGQFLGYVDAVHERYGLPIWVTEYGLMNFGGSPRYPTGAQAAAFITGSTAGMQSREYVERYAWFGLPAVGDSVDFGLYTDASTPTEAGAAYRAAG